MKKFDEKKAMDGITMFLQAYGVDLNEPGLQETPRRIVQAYKEFLSGDNELNTKILSTDFIQQYDEMIVVRDIPFVSMCEHHFLPFWGKAHVSYLPKGKVVGLSKVARLVENIARQPQIQERMTKQVADSIENTLETDGVGVVITAEHSCLSFRGIKKHGSTMITSAMNGNFRTDAKTRSEFMSIIQVGILK
ncbi:MAG: GTP cyclohydrolase I FolE [Dehalococcoidaceae bacterium]|nr:GTP cyclohydrolase I FolE [Dehalococcoidaceae bacterium]